MRKERVREIDRVRKRNRDREKAEEKNAMK
jgi:hypothetical protein